MARPLTKTYSPTHPYTVERHDQDDGSIAYEVVDNRPESYWIVCAINDRYDERDEKMHGAKRDAETIARALNLMNGGFS